MKLLTTKLLRTRLAALLLLVTFANPASALEQREFFNKDKTKSFAATLTFYDEIKGLVFITLESGEKKKFSLKLLSEKDQEYVLANADVLAAIRGLEVKFREVKGEHARSKSGMVSTRSTPTGYKITLYNRSKQEIEDVEVRYSYYYCVGSSSATGPRHTPKVRKGVLNFPKMYGQYNEVRDTDLVTLVRQVKKGVSPPVPMGGGWCSINEYPDGRQDLNHGLENDQDVALCAGAAAGFRRIDHVIGIVAEVVVDDKVVRTVGTSSQVLKTHKEGSIK